MPLRFAALLVKTRCSFLRRVNLALIHPRLLSAVILIDPVIQIASGMPEGSNVNLPRLSTFRRDIWPSRAEAAASLKKNKFYRSWDPRVLDRWIEYGLRDVPTAIHPDTPAIQRSGSRINDIPVTLSTNKHQEVFTFVRPNFEGLDEQGEQIVKRLTHADLDLTQIGTYPFYAPELKKIYDNLPHLRPGALYIFGGQSPLSPPEWRKQKIDRTGTGVGGSGGAVEGRVKEVVFEDAGHLLPMEIVQNVADAIGGWAVEELKRWRRLEKEWQVKWEAKSKEERMMITEEWSNKVGGDPKGPGSGKL